MEDDVRVLGVLHGDRRGPGRLPTLRGSRASVQACVFSLQVLDLQRPGAIDRDPRVVLELGDRFDVLHPGDRGGGVPAGLAGQDGQGVDWQGLVSRANLIKIGSNRFYVLFAGCHVNDDRTRFVPYPNDWRWFVANSGDLKISLGGKRPSHGEGGTDKEALVLQTHTLQKNFMIMIMMIVPPGIP